MTTTYYQRFKAQKLTGSQYPWLKKNKLLRSGQTSRAPTVVLRNSYASQSRFVLSSLIPRKKNNIIVILNRSIVRSNRNSNISRYYNVEPAVLTVRRRSSDIYLEPESRNDGLSPSTAEIQTNEAGRNLIVYTTSSAP